MPNLNETAIETVAALVTSEVATPYEAPDHSVWAGDWFAVDLNLVGFHGTLFMSSSDYNALLERMDVRPAYTRKMIDDAIDQVIPNAGVHRHDGFTRVQLLEMAAKEIFVEGVEDLLVYEGYIIRKALQDLRNHGRFQFVPSMEEAA